MSGRLPGGGAREGTADLRGGGHGRSRGTTQELTRGAESEDPALDTRGPLPAGGDAEGPDSEESDSWATGGPDPVGGHARGPESEESLSWGTGGPEPANGHAREPEFAEPLAEGPGGGGRLSRGPAAVNPAEPGRNTEIR